MTGGMTGFEVDEGALGSSRAIGLSLARFASGELGSEGGG